MTDNNDNSMEKVVSLAKRRGFVFPGSEIYGGYANSYDFGPLGVELFHNIASLWWKFFVQKRGDIYGVKGPIIMNPKVWEASGHTKHFADPLVECRVCHARLRADKSEEIKAHEETHDGQDVSWTEPKQFNQLFKTYVGAVEDEKSLAYLRGETAQTMFTDFKLIMDAMRAKLPFGIAQIGTSFRNEITTGNFLFRKREFTIAEFEYFVKPGEDEKVFDEILDLQEEFLVGILGLDRKNLKKVDLSKDELAHYSKRTVDWYYKYPFGWDEMTGIANRTDFDLKNHIDASGEDLKYKEPEGDEFIPYVIEPTFGLDRIFLAILVDAYHEVDTRSGETDSKHEKEVVLRLNKNLAPYKIAVLPLSKKEEVSSVAKEIVSDLRNDFTADYDETGSIGKRYRRQDEIGTPFCVTVDFDSLEDKKVTVRDRDTMEQDRIDIADLDSYLMDKLS